jgi:hypothetical protein
LRKPSLLPVSNLSHFVSKAKISLSCNIRAKASASRISQYFFDSFTCSKYPNISGVKTYFPITPRRESVAQQAGFSRKLLTLTISSS